MILTVANTKGGVGKTTTACEIGAISSRSGRTLIVDVDSQSSVAAALGIDIPRGSIGLGEVLIGDANGYFPEAVEAVIPTHLQNLSVLPATDYLGNAGTGDYPLDEFKLRDVLRPLTNTYDLIICDSQPSRGSLLNSALFACSAYVVPVSTDWKSVHALGGFLAMMEAFRAQVGDEMPRELGVVLTRCTKRNAVSPEAEAEVRHILAERVFKTSIREDANAARASAYGVTIHEMTKKRSADDYHKLYREIVRRLRLMGGTV